MKKLTKNISYLFLLLFSLAFCLFYNNQLESYQAATPPHIGSILEPYRAQGVHIRAKAYNSDESNAYLNRNLLSKGLQPIQVTIQNNSAKSYLLSKEGLEFDDLSASAVANTMCQGYIPRSIAFKVASFFFWPFVIPSTIDSIATFAHHREMKRDYAAKSLKEEGEVLLPYSTTHRVIFVRTQDVQEHFVIALQDLQNGRYQPYPTKIEMS